MADRIYLSCWFRGMTGHNLLALFEKVLLRFPFSRLAPGVAGRVHAIDYSEAPVAERQLDPGEETGGILKLFREFENPDCAYEVTTCWDLWRFERDWSLAPAPVAITCYGPLFPSEFGEQLRIDFGPNTQFLPSPEIGRDWKPLRGNIRSLLHLAGDIGRAVALERRSLWSESGENLGARLEEELRG